MTKKEKPRQLTPEEIKERMAKAEKLQGQKKERVVPPWVKKIQEAEERGERPPTKRAPMTNVFQKGIGKGKQDPMKAARRIANERLQEREAQKKG